MYVPQEVWDPLVYFAIAAIIVKLEHMPRQEESADDDSTGR